MVHPLPATPHPPGPATSLCSACSTQWECHSSVARNWTTPTPWHTLSPSLTTLTSVSLCVALTLSHSLLLSLPFFYTVLCVSLRVSAFFNSVTSDAANCDSAQFHYAKCSLMYASLVSFPLTLSLLPSRFLLSPVQLAWLWVCMSLSAPCESISIIFILLQYPSSLSSPLPPFPAAVDTWQRHKIFWHEMRI